MAYSLDPTILLLIFGILSFGLILLVFVAACILVTAAGWFVLYSYQTQQQLVDNQLRAAHQHSLDLLTERCLPPLVLQDREGGVSIHNLNHPPQPTY